MSKRNLYAAALCVTAATIAGNASFAAAKDAKATNGDKSQKNPEWVVVEQSWFYPLRFDPVLVLDSARYHYRRGEEDAAASDVRRAIGWLDYAASHAMPITKSKIEDAKSTLQGMADDLENGRITSAVTLDSALASASRAQRR
ncbi:MAG: hypothetical protein R3C10_04625 [Pirellulales bacterium]